MIRKLIHTLGSVMIETHDTYRKSLKYGYSYPDYLFKLTQFYVLRVLLYLSYNIRYCVSEYTLSRSPEKMLTLSMYKKVNKKNPATPEEKLLGTYEEHGCREIFFLFDKEFVAVGAFPTVVVRGDAVLNVIEANEKKYSQRKIQRLFSFLQLRFVYRRCMAVAAAEKIVLRMEKEKFEKTNGL